MSPLPEGVPPILRSGVLGLNDLGASHVDGPATRTGLDVEQAMRDARETYLEVMGDRRQREADKTTPTRKSRFL